MWSSHAWHTEYHIKLAPVAEHRMWDQFHEQNFVYRFMGLIWQLAKTLACESCVFCPQWQLLVCQSDFTIYALLPEAIFGCCASRMRDNTTKLVQHSWRSFPIHPYLCSHWWLVSHAQGFVTFLSLTSDVQPTWPLRWVRIHQKEIILNCQKNGGWKSGVSCLCLLIA